MIIDLAWNIDAWEILDWCRSHDVLYVNTSIEEWDPYRDDKRTDPTKYTLYYRHMNLRRLMEKKWGNEKGATAIIDHGANPGLVSHFTKKALIDIAKKILREKPKDSRAKNLERFLSEKNFAKSPRSVSRLSISANAIHRLQTFQRVNEFVNVVDEGFMKKVCPGGNGMGNA